MNLRVFKALQICWALAKKELAGMLDTCPGFDSPHRPLTHTLTRLTLNQNAHKKPVVCVHLLSLSPQQEMGGKDRIS